MNALNDNADGPYAFADDQLVAAWNTTQWLIDYVEDNNEVNNAKWSDWTYGADIADVYQSGQREIDPECQHGRNDITDRGRAILTAAVSGADWEPLMSEWADEIYEQGAA